jgi:uncharacterized protein (DUF2141 family)
MTFKKPLFFCSLFLLAFVLYRCAQVVPLTGGDKDTKPPVLLLALPLNKSVNVPPQKVKIVFTFNEFISGQAISQKLMINPLISETPDVTISGKTLTVEFEKPLFPNTTYFLQFGNAVTDIHEGNAFPDLNYIFSTGPVLDSASITGKVSYALSKKPVADISVMLYKNLNDSAPRTSVPDYITKTDEKGNYFLSAIKPGIYKVMAVNDKNKNQLYDLSEAFAFLNAPVEINKDTVNFDLSTAKTSQFFIKKKIQAFWGYNKYVLNDTFPNAYIITEKSIDTDNYLYEMRNDTLEIYYKNLYSRNFDFVLKNEKESYDTISLAIPEKMKVDSTIDKALKKISLRTEKSSYGVKHDDVLLNFSVPIKNIEPAKCLLLKDTVKEIPVFTSENSNEEGTLVTTYLPSYKKRLTNKLVPQKSYVLLFLPSAIQTFWGTYNTDTLKTTFKTFATDEMGSLQVKLVLHDTIKNYVLEVLNEKGIVVRTCSGANKKDVAQLFYNLPAGDYLLRLTDDKDQNRKFSPADYLKNKQPETVYFYDKPVKIPAGWDVETEWKIIDQKK